MTKFTTRRGSSRRSLPAEDQQRPLHVSRTFDPDAIDIDDLAEAVRQLLGSSDDIGSEPQHDPHLLFKRRRVSHVMGAKGAPGT